MVQTTKNESMNINKVNATEGGASMRNNKKKQTPPGEPPCTIIERNKPNLKLMAKAFTHLYQHVKVHQPELLD